MATCDRILTVIGDVVDVVMSFDDLATQDRLIVSPMTYQKLLEPRLARFYRFLRTRTAAKILFHTDGAASPIFESLIAMGIDGVNPLQVSTKGLSDVAALKKQFGGRLFFWGGIDTQQTLPRGTADDVRNEVEGRIRSLNDQGGYVLCAVHNIQSDVPAENIIAMYATGSGNKITKAVPARSPE